MWLGRAERGRVPGSCGGCGGTEHARGPPQASGRAGEPTAEDAVGPPDTRATMRADGCPGTAQTIPGPAEASAGTGSTAPAEAVATGAAGAVRSAGAPAGLRHASLRGDGAGGAPLRAAGARLGGAPCTRRRGRAPRSPGTGARRAGAGSAGAHTAGTLDRGRGCGPRPPHLTSVRRPGPAAYRLLATGQHRRRGRCVWRRQKRASSTSPCSSAPFPGRGAGGWCGVSP